MINTEIEILLIEDSEDDAEMTIRALQKNNITNKILHMKDGAEALNFIFETGNRIEKFSHPRLILLDLKMPKINGIQVLEKIKSDERTKKIPVVVLTSSKEDPDVDKCYTLGVNSYIVKPVGFESFSNAISQLGFYWMILNQPPK